MRGVGWGLGAIALGVVGCVSRLIVFAETEGEGSSGDADVTSSTGSNSGSSGGEDSGAPTDLDVGGVAPPTERFVSILFVIDDSVSMGVPQIVLPSSMVALLEPLDEAGVDYRLAFTTTDNGNYWCLPGGFISDPEGGNFVASSCATRLFDFVSTQENEQEVCLDQCLIDEVAIQPSSTELDPEPRARPWLESVRGATNLPPEVDLLDAIACVMPQGVAGCGFEQPLESMYRAIARAQTTGENEYGFFNPAGLAVIVFVTDEVDCSTNNAYDEIFAAEGSRVFWSNPEEAVPTSALCWNAGVRCEGGNGAMLSCVPENHDVDGVPGVSEDFAVMRPVQRYVDALAGLGNAYVAAIDGVPEGYASGGADIQYKDVGDPDFLRDFGIAPGCENGEVRAVPPVRLEAVVEATNGVGTRDLFSICDLDYGAHLKTIADRIVSRLP
jgi:hypothetical protein